MSESRPLPRSMCPRCIEDTLEPRLDATGALTRVCRRCAAVFCEGAEVARFLGGPVPRSTSASIGLDLDPPVRLWCPTCAEASLVPARAADVELHRCQRCAGLFVDGGPLARLRTAARAARPPPPFVPDLPVPRELRVAELDDRLPFRQPMVDLVALPLVLGLAFLVSRFELGRLLLWPAAIQFHELGHAIPAWLSARAALPLPCGLTFWSATPSLFTGASVLFLAGLLAFRGWREKRPFAVVVGATLIAIELVFALFVSPAASERIVLLSGIAGETVVATFAMVAFYFPMPDRFRWDFFRFLVIVPASGSWMSSVVLWSRVARGLDPLPIGSIVGMVGDGSGDLERLMQGHDFAASELVQLYVTLDALTGLVLLSVYAHFAFRAVAVLRGRHPRD